MNESESMGDSNGFHFFHYFDETCHFTVSYCMKKKVFVKLHCFFMKNEKVFYPMGLAYSCQIYYNVVNSGGKWMEMVQNVRKSLKLEGW